MMDCSPGSSWGLGVLFVRLLLLLCHCVESRIHCSKMRAVQLAIKAWILVIDDIAIQRVY